MKINSIIQSTLVRISILIFCIFLVLYFYIAGIYWDKEVYHRELELLTMASTVAVHIQANLDQIRIYKEDSSLSKQEKAEEIHSLLRPSLDKFSSANPDNYLGFCDYELDSTFSLSPEDDVLFITDGYQPDPFLSMNTTGEPQFLYDEALVAWDGKGVIGVTIPTYYEDKIIGHIWTGVKADKAIFISYLDYAKVLVLGIILWILVLLIIKKYLKKIQLSLDEFSQMIVESNFQDQQILSGFPELVPVFDRIRIHLDSLTELNAKLENSNEKMLTIMEGIKDGFYSLDNNWRFTFVNKVMKKLMNKEDLVGKNIWDEYGDNIDYLTHDKLQEAVREKKPVHWEDLSAQDNKYYEYHAYPFTQGISVFFRDVTESKRQEAELVRLERLNLIGQLAAGISHEVRNPLTTVRGFLQMLELRSDSSQNKEYMEIMISEIDRANEIITDFLSLARVNAESTKQENINDIVMRIFPMIQADAFNSDKDVVLHLQETPAIELNESEMRQLILNLVRNGLEETPRGGQVIIRTFTQENQVILTIKDQGRGIPQEIQEQIGTPFMTTKETGTGLGLAISMGIASRHKARFEFETGETGTTFYIKFPKEN